MRGHRHGVLPGQTSRLSQRSDDKEIERNIKLSSFLSLLYSKHYINSLSTFYRRNLTLTCGMIKRVIFKLYLHEFKLHGG